LVYRSSKCPLVSDRQQRIVSVRQIAGRRVASLLIAVQN